MTHDSFIILRSGFQREGKHDESKIMFADSHIRSDDFANCSL